jgi:hypothetical protein
VRGTVGIAPALRISSGIIAATVAAFATSSPELADGGAALVWMGQPQRAERCIRAARTRNLLRCTSLNVERSAIGTIDARHGSYPWRFGQGFEIEKPVADGRG